MSFLLRTAGRPLRGVHAAGIRASGPGTGFRVAGAFLHASCPRPAAAGGAGDDSSDNGDGGLLDHPPDLSTHYTIFPRSLPAGPPPTGAFAVPVSQLKREFLELQSGAHPDKHAPGPHKAAAEALSARLNEAFRVLADPLARAQYLLALRHGVDVTSEDNSSQPMDQQTLMQVMEVQEAIEEAADEQTIADLMAQNEERIAVCEAALGRTLEADRGDEARTECVRLKFFYNVRQALREWEPGKTVSIVH